MYLTPSFLSGLNHTEYEQFVMACSTFLVKKRIPPIINFKLFLVRVPRVVNGISVPIYLSRWVENLKNASSAQPGEVRTFGAGGHQPGASRGDPWGPDTGDLRGQ